VLRRIAEPLELTPGGEVKVDLGYDANAADDPSFFDD
jgi:hypothetical protein